MIISSIDLAILFYAVCAVGLILVLFLLHSEWQLRKALGKAKELEGTLVIKQGAIDFQKELFADAITQNKQLTADNKSLQSRLTCKTNELRNLALVKALELCKTTPTSDFRSDVKWIYRFLIGKE